MKKFFQIFCLQLAVLVLVLSSSLSTKAITEAIDRPIELTYASSTTHDYLIYTMFIPSNTSSNSIVLDMSTNDSEQTASNYFYAYYNNALDSYELRLENTQHIITSYFTQYVYAFYIRHNSELTVANNSNYYRVFIFQLPNNKNGEQTAWEQIGRFDINTISVLNKIAVSSRVMFKSYYLPSNNETKLNIVINTWNTDMLYNDYTALGSWSDIFMNDYNEGLDEGFRQGLEAGYTPAYNDGYSDGYIEGETVGYARGENSLNFSIFFKSIWDTLAGFFGITIFGGVTLGTIISIPIVFGLIMLILSFWRSPD